MAEWKRIETRSTAGNIELNVDIGIESVTRTSNSNVRVVYGVRFTQYSNTYTYNSIAAFCPKDSGNRYYAFNSGRGAKHTSKGTYYYANTSGSTTTSPTCPFTIDIPVGITQTSASFEVGYGWDDWTPSQKGGSSIEVSFPTGATAPTGLWCNIIERTETAVSISGGYTSDGGSGVTSSGYQYSTNGSTWYNCSSYISGLSPGTTYYFRYYATNSQGTSYSDGSANATTYKYPYVVSFKTNPLKIGTTPIIEVYNPLKRSCTAYIKQDTSSGTPFGSISGFTYGSSNYEVPVNASTMYNSIPNSKTGTMICYLVCSEVSYTSPVVSGTYSIKNDGTEIPTFSENYWSYVANLTQLTNNNQVIINGYSKVDFSINTPASSNYGSPISYYNYKWGNSSNRTGSITGGNGNVLEVSAVDSRGFPKTTQKTLASGTNYISYTTPRLDYSNSYTQRVNGIAAETYLTLQGNLSVMKFGSDGIANAIHSCKYKVYNYSTGAWSDEFTIPVSEISLNSSGYFSLNDYMIHANGSSGGFTVGVRYGIQIILQDANGLLATLTSNLIQVTDGKIARDVYQDSNGDYHQGINGMGNDNFANTIHGSENITGDLYVNSQKMIYNDNSTMKYNKNGEIDDSRGNDLDKISMVITGNKPKYLYNGQTGAPGYLKVCHIPGNGQWGRRQVVLLLTGGNYLPDSGAGIIVINTSATDSIQCQVISGKIDLNRIFTIKNSDNSYDVYFYQNSYYMPLFVQLISYNTMTNDYEDAEPLFTGIGWIGTTKPTGVAEIKFTYSDDSGWIYPTLNSGWSNPYSQAAVRYRKIRNVVYLETFCDGTADASSTIFTLPEGFRPTRNFNRFPVYTYQGIQTAGISSTGTVECYNKSGSVTWFNIHISFIVD